MYPVHFGMSENPFTTDADPKFLWLGGKREEILAGLVRGILDRAGVHVVLGAPGMGKTQLANAVADELGDRARAVVVPCAEYRGIDFLKLVERSFGIGKDPRGQESFADRFSEFLRRSGASGKPVVLIVDDAHRLDGSSLLELSTLSKLEESGMRLMQLVFLGENQFRDVVNDEANRELFESAGMRLTLDPLSRDETAQYVRHRLRVTQCDRELFTSDAVDEIVAFSKGVPRLVNKACEAALSRAFYLGENLVPQDTVREALRLMPPDKKTPAGESGNLSFELAAAAGAEKDGEEDDEDEPGIPAGQVRRQNRSWIAYAVLGCVLIALIAVASVVLKGKQSAVPASADVKRAVTPDSVPSAEKAAPVPAVKAQIVVPERQQAPAVSAGQSPGSVTEIREEKKKPRQAARTRQAAVKSPRREPAPPAAVAPAGDAGRDLSADREGTARQETAPQKTEQVESGEVIDFMLKKRSGQR
jgi:type II secretory pathway predicted ATPase ExeA